MARIRASLMVGVLCLLGALSAARTPATASPWAEVGDAVLRSDIEVLTQYGLIDGLVTTWPIPWAQISHRLVVEDVSSLPPHIRRSLRRVRDRMARETAIKRFRFEAIGRVSSEPALVRDFGPSGRREIDARARGEWMTRTMGARLSVGYQSDIDFGSGDLSFDDSYFALSVANWIVYGGTLDQWWGPGEVSSLILSNNARPFPRVGLMRRNPTAFETPWLSWIGPWQFNAFGGVLDEGRRVISNPLVLGFRVAFSPLPGVEIGATRALMICGGGRPCEFGTFVDAFIGNDFTGDPLNDPGNQLEGLDLRFSSRLGGQYFTLYGQIIGEAEEFLIYPDLAGLVVGLTLWGGIGGEGALWRLTTEYSDSTSYQGALPLSDARFGVFYNHFIYKNGYRYRRRALGHSLDGDARLFSVVGTLTDLRDWTYRLAYHHAELNRDSSGPHPVSLSNEDINLFEIGLNVPWRKGSFAIELRLQDDEPNTPGTSDFLASIEATWTFRF